MSLLLSGCAFFRADDPMESSAVYAEEPPVIDGKLNDPVWKKAPAYPLILSENPYGNLPSRFTATLPGKVRESGTVMFAWDKEFLYVAAQLEDADIIAYGEENHIPHFCKGDVLEVFLNPAGQLRYWELYGTPHGKLSNYFFPSGGHVWLPSVIDRESELKVASQIDGTLNKWQDADKGWTTEMAMPVRMLTAYGDSFGPGSHWRVLIGRYNYGASLPRKELSSFPQLPVPNFHLLTEFGKIKFLIPESR